MTGLYSPINKLMEQVTRPKGTGAEYMAELQKKPGYKPAEAEDRDLQALMALPQMERAAFMEKLQAQKNKFPLKMRELGQGQTHHDTYTLPGGENYREILLHTPDTKREELKKKLGEIGDLMNSANTTPEQYKKLRATREALSDQYTYGTEGSFGGNAAHFGGMPNILASIRVKDRTSPEGKKILHIEEIQSDWHQQGREAGYHPKDLYAQIREAKAEKKMMDRYLKEADEDSSDMAYGEYGRMMDDHQAAIQKLDKLEQLKEEGVPRGPHAKDWHELALKAMIQHAAENGYDQIAVTPGAEQAKRFGLSKQVGSVSYNPETQHFQAFKPNRETIVSEKGASPERIKALIGKETAEKLMQAPQQMGHHYLEGEDLDMGGEGMKGFYDKMVPTFLNKFGKKHGVQVQQGTVDTVNPSTNVYDIGGGRYHTEPYGTEHPSREEAVAHIRSQTAKPVHTFDITPAMREDVLKNGIPRYAEGGEINDSDAPPMRMKLKSNDDTASKRMIDDVYSRYPVHPFNAKQRAMIEGEGDSQTLGTFELKPSMSARNSVELSWLSSYPHKQGVGSRTLKKLQEHAAEHNVGLTLFPWEHGGVSQSKLMKFYKKHGFAPTVKGGKNMAWKPETKAEGGDVSRGTVKEKVTISPNMDVMQYELINKKVK